MAIKRSVLTIFLISVLVLSINSINIDRAKAQWFGPSYMINISISPNYPYNSQAYDELSVWGAWGKEFSPFDSQPFFSGRSYGFGSGRNYGFSPIKTGLNLLNSLSYTAPESQGKNYLDSNNTTHIKSALSESVPVNHGCTNTYPLIKGIFLDNLLPPGLIDEFPIYNMGYAMAVMNDYLVLCKGELTAQETGYPITVFNLEVINLKDPNGYTRAGGLRFESESGSYEKEKIKKLIINEGLAYILANDPAGLYIVDLADIETPELINYSGLDFTRAMDMEIIKDWAFITFYDYDSIVTSWNLTNPLGLVFEHYLVLDGMVKDTFIQEEVLVAIGDDLNGLTTIDISKPHEMEILDHNDLPGDAVWMIGGGILTAGGGKDGLSRFRILDYKDLEGPIEAYALNLLGKEGGVCAKGDTYYVLTYSTLNDLSRIYVFTLNETTLKPNLENTIKFDGKCIEFKVYHEYLSAQLQDKVLLWDITNPRAPEMIDPVDLDFSWTLNYAPETGKRGINDEVTVEREQSADPNSYNPISDNPLPCPFFPFPFGMPSPFSASFFNSSPFTDISSETMPYTKWDQFYLDNQGKSGNLNLIPTWSDTAGFSIFIQYPYLGPM